MSGHYAYVGHYASGFRIWDISNPYKPVFMSTIYDGGPHPREFALQGHYAYVLLNGNNQMKVLDITNPSFPTEVGSVTTDARPYSIGINGRYAYVINQSSSTLQTFDISNPTALVSVSKVNVGGGGGDHSVAISGHMIFVAQTGNATGVMSVSWMPPIRPARFWKASLLLGTPIPRALIPYYLRTLFVRGRY